MTTALRARKIARVDVLLEPPLRTIPELLERRANELGEQPLLSVNGMSVDYRTMRDLAAGYAGRLAVSGVRHGDRVAVLAENCFELLALWAGCAWLGAILVPINTASRGAQLEHVLANAVPKVLAAESDLLEHVAALEHVPEEVERLWIIGERGLRVHGLSPEPFPEPGTPLPRGTLKPGDTLAILYTSGTTGPSKGVCCPHAQFYWYAVNTAAMLGVREDDVLYTCLPLFHINALNTFVQALVHGARCVVGPRFSASQFWSVLAESGATVTYILGAMASILGKSAASAADTAHSVRVALAPATPAHLHDVFRQRFGVTLVDGYAMTETNVVIGPRDREQRPGYMGRLLAGFDARVVDEEDVEVRDGTPGELVMRADQPFAFATGYWRMPEQTLAAWRNLWFHSGDRVLRTADGYFLFIDRIKDAIRRRGENISAWEVEQVLQNHPDVTAVAVIPVPSELGEDEVMAWVIPRDGAEVDPLELIKYCEHRLAYFAIPRYVELIDGLPLTENGKVRKFVLRERGITATTWDREAAGYKPARR
jgi:crotonobetaine/carnitine-CoA ligase